MRKIAANMAFNGIDWIKNPLLHIAEDGTIIKIDKFNPQKSEPANTEFYSGILVPGFINAHTHLELSVHKHLYQNSGGIIDFVKHVLSCRKNGFLPDDIEMRSNLHYLRKTGTVACADICNTEKSFATKQNSDILFQNFFEFLPISVNQVLSQKKLYYTIKEKFPEQNISPVFHSPYALTEVGLQELNEIFKDVPNTSLHFRESEAELLLHRDDSEIVSFYQNFDSNYKPAFRQPEFSYGLGKTLKNAKRILMVHNVSISEEDIIDLINWSEKYDVYLSFVLCPRSNMCISNAFPKLKLLKKHNLNICLGTDSLLSTPNLSIFDEMKFLQQNFTDLTMSEIIRMVTYNAADSLGWTNMLGSLEVGKKPGVNLIYSVDYKQNMLTSDALLKQLV
jgi:cytosine/adenosine deaminase-related metal-dependent hydrolase